MIVHAFAGATKFYTPLRPAQKWQFTNPASFKGQTQEATRNYCQVAVCCYNHYNASHTLMTPLWATLTACTLAAIFGNYPIV